jgi:hypothetical protein
LTRKTSEISFIFPAESNFEKTTNSQSFLFRENAIEPIFEEWDELTDEDKQTLIQGFEQPNAQGEYEEFWAAIAYFFNAYSP